MKTLNLIIAVILTTIVISGCGRGSAAPSSGPPAPLTHVYSDGTIIQGTSGGHSTTTITHATGTTEVQL